MPVRLLGSVVVLAIIGVASAFTFLALGIGKLIAPGSTFDQNGAADVPGFDTATGVVSVISRATGLCGIPFLLFGIWFLLYLWRAGAWLDGTEVSFRTALSTRHADLATSSVTMSGVSYVHNNTVGAWEHRTVIRVPALAVTAPGSRRPIKIPLRGQGLDLLPSSQLRALSDALAANVGPDAARARAVGDHLRRLAEDPLAY